MATRIQKMPQPPTGATIATYDTYEQAQRAGDEDELPVVAGQLKLRSCGAAGASCR